VTERRRLDNRRKSETFSFDCGGQRYIATISRFADDNLAEIFLSSNKPGSQADTNARDSAVVASIALQGGIPVDTIRHALLRDAQGVASSPLGMALDLVTSGGVGERCLES
jgi:hypothetical protein